MYSVRLFLPAATFPFPVNLLPSLLSHQTPTLILIPILSSFNLNPHSHCYLVIFPDKFSLPLPFHSHNFKHESCIGVPVEHMTKEVIGTANRLHGFRECQSFVEECDVGVAVARKHRNRQGRS